MTEERMQDIPSNVYKELQAVRVLATDGTADQVAWARETYLFLWRGILGLPSPPVEHKLGSVQPPPPPRKKAKTRKIIN